MKGSAGPEKDEGFEEPAAVGKVTLHSLDYWVIDSGATYSMTPRADLLTELEPSPVKHVTSALGQRAEVKGMGKAMFKGADGKMVGLKNSDYEKCAFAFFSPVEMPEESATLKEALESSDAEEWKKAMESELKSIEENGTWELVELPEGRKAITSKWLFKIKSDANGNIERYKSRLVAKGYQQKEKVDSKELFAPVVKPTTLRTLLAGAAIKEWVVKQMHVTTAFLNGILEEEIFMAQPEGLLGVGKVVNITVFAAKSLGGAKPAQHTADGDCVGEGAGCPLSMRPGDDVKPVLDKIKDTYARMAAAGSNVSQMQQCTKIISVLENSWDNLIPTLNTQQDQWTPEWLRQQILQEDFRRHHTGGGAANKTAEGYGAAGGSRGRGGGRGALLPVIGVGNAKVMGANGGLVGLGNVLLVEGLSANLLSVRRLQKSKAKVTFGPTSCRAKLGKFLLWDLEEKSSCIKNLWQLPIISWNGKPPATAAAAATAKTTAGGEETAPTDGALDAVKKVQQSQQPHGEVLAGVDATATLAKASSGNGDAGWETWHERLCHINIPMLQKLVKDGSLKGLEVKGAGKEIGSCPTCLETKFTKFPFSSGTGPAKAPLALVHMDVVGPTRTPSLSGSRYFLTIVDDHTRAVWVYPLKTKGELAAAVLKEWMPRAQRESGHKVKVIRTDNGGEFIGADFELVLKKKGIQHQLTVPYNPQQNGVAERFNRTLQEGARTLLGRAGLPDPFWVTALWQVALVKNRVLASVGDKQWVPYTKWYGSAPAVNMLRAYGCMVVFHVPKEKRGKLEASGRWGVHLGLAKDHKGWLIWDLTRQQLTVSRDVKFLESLYYKEWKQQQQKLPTTPLIIEAYEVQRPSRQVQVTVSEEEISGVTEDGGEPEVEEQQQQDAPQGAARLADRPRRDVRPPNWLTYPSFGKPNVVRAGSVAQQCDEEEIAHCYWAAVPEPKMLAEALSGPDAEKWKQSVKEEYDSLLENETWELCELPPGKKAISSKLIFRHKYGPDGELTRYKSRLVAKGF
ncbi:unnamed protein product [Closterium sp. NIES-54]